MVLEILTKLLGNRPIELLTRINPQQQVQGLSSIEHLIDDFSDTVLYYGTYKQLVHCTSPSQCANSLFLFLDEDITDSNVWSAFRNVIAVRDYDEYKECLEIIKKGLKEHHRFEQGHRKLFNMIVSNRPLASLADEIAFMYEHYVDIIDNSLNILAISESVMPPSSNLLEDHRTRLVKPNVVQYLRLSGSLNQMRNSRGPVLVEDVPRDTYAYTVPIFIGNTLIAGYICFFIQKQELFSPVALYYMPETAKLIGLEMQKKQGAQTNKATYFTHLLTDMLQGVPAVVSSYEERFLAFDYHLKNLMRVIVLPLNSSFPLNIDINILSETLQSMITNSVYAVYENYIVFLSTSNKISEFRENNAMIKEYLGSNKIKIGVSSSFENESFVKDHFEQAKSALRLGEQFYPREIVFTYDKIRMLDFVDKLSGVKNLQLLCFPPLMILQSTDQKDPRNALMHTLYTYLKNGQSIAKTCSELYIHRNTLYYRLQKIKEIMDCDFTELEVLSQITFTFSILQYLGQLKGIS